MDRNTNIWKAVRMGLLAVFVALAGDAWLFSGDCKAFNKGRFCKHLMLTQHYDLILADLRRHSEDDH